MTAEQALPPKWAQRLLELTLRERDRNTIVGDLIEEYRERLCQGQHGRRVDTWYTKQVASLLWVAAAPGPLLLAAAVCTSVLNAAWPTTESGHRLASTLVTTGAIYFLVGVQSGWLTRRLRAGAAMLLNAAVIALLVNPAAVLIHWTLWREPPTASALRISGGHLALLMFPGLPLGLLMALGGAAFIRMVSVRKAC
jgi:hypothetical protein